MKKWIASLAILFMSELAAAAWGAIAYDTTTGAWGLSWGWYNQQQAESTAISYCGQPNCRVYITGQNTYLSLATSNYDKSWAGFGRATVKYESMYWSMYYCNQGYYSCTLKASFPTNQ
ncbi:MAG: DUF4189 domain-containing protein [Bdellovibrio sp.]|jgi:hypothetical protein|nr:DUF4189 domain-containing protein [Bdellovibrio sp.]